MTQMYGITYCAPNGDACLPLEKVEVHADIIDLSAFVTVTQNYYHNFPSALNQAKYVFPMPARAAICGFVLSIENDSVITAVAKEKAEAKQQYNEAVMRGQLSGLVEYVTDDVFSIAVGAIPTEKQIVCKITYVIDLLDAEKPSSVRLQLPVGIGARYGIQPFATYGASQVPADRVSIAFDIHMTGYIKSVTSPTHPFMTVDPQETISAFRAGAKYRSSEYLSRDFVLVVDAENLDKPRCLAQRNDKGVTAAQLTFVPDPSKLQSIAAQEYIFLIDRSGSMSGDRMKRAKVALVSLLRGLPSVGTSFNIFSFGSRCDSLWSRSQEYNQANLNTATTHIDKMSANYGGTEIRAALERVFATRNTEVPAACFVLTDGESWDEGETIDSVALAAKTAKETAPLRVFTLGIGNTTSTSMCEGIARAGNGLCLMSVGSETILAKCAKLLRAASTHILKNAVVEWGDDGGSERPPLLQGPVMLDAIYPGNRFIAFALIEDEKYQAPEHVVLKAHPDGSSSWIKQTIPLKWVGDLSYGTSESHGANMLHTLAARRIIMDLEDRNRTNVDPNSQQLITRLGVTYQLASRFTSFVATDETGKDVGLSEIFLGPGLHGSVPLAGASGARKRSSKSRVGSRGGGRGGALGKVHVRPRPDSFGGPAPAFAASPRIVQVGGGPGPTGDQRFGASSCQQAQPSAAQLTIPLLARPVTFGALAPAFAASPRIVQRGGGPGLTSDARFGASSGQQAQMGAAQLTPSAPKKRKIEGSAPAENCEGLIRLQFFDGSFARSTEFERIIGEGHFSKARELAVMESAWATALAIAYLKKHMVGAPDLLESLVEKAVAFLKASQSEMDNEALLVEAEEAIA